MTTSTFNPTSAVTGVDWNTPSDWMPMAVPNSLGADVLIPLITEDGNPYDSELTIEPAETYIVNSLTIIQQNLTLDGSLSIVSDLALDQGNFEIMGSVAMAGLTNTGSMEISGSGQIASLGSVENQGDTISRDLQIEASGVIASSGMIDNQGTIANLDGELALDFGGLKNDGMLFAEPGSLEVNIAVGSSGFANLLSDVLTLGTYEAGPGGVLNLNVGRTIVGDAAKIILAGSASPSGAAPIIETSNAADGTVHPITQTLQTIAPTGTLELDNAAFASTNPLVDNGVVQLDGGALAVAGLNIGQIGTVVGFGTMSGPVTDDGYIGLTGGDTLTLGGPLNGTGTIAILSASTYFPSGGIGFTTLEINGSVATISFSDWNGALLIDHPTQFSGTISGFSVGTDRGGGLSIGNPPYSFENSDTILLNGLSLSAITSVGYNGTASGGTLILQEATGAVALNFLGNYTVGSFVLSQGPQSLSTSPPSVEITEALPGPAITGTATNLAVTDQQNAEPFSTATIADPLGSGEVETMTVTLSNPANGTLTNLDGGTYNAATGVYTVTGSYKYIGIGVYTTGGGDAYSSSAAAVTAALDGLVFTPTTHQATSGQTVTTTFTIADTDTSAETATASTTATVTETTANSTLLAALVTAYYQAVSRTTPPASVIQLDANQLSAGTLTTSELLTQLLSTAQSTTIPALLAYDFMAGVAPNSRGITYLSTYAADLQSGDYTYNGGFALGTTPGQYNLPQFSVPNTYVNFCATDVQLQGNPFTAAYGSLAATASIANRTTFFDDVYQQIFGSAPAAATVALFVTNPAAADTSITTFQYYVNYAGSELGGYGAIAGVLLSAAETPPTQSGPYPGAVNSFLTTAAISTAAGSDAAPYSASLLTAFPAGAASRSSETEAATAAPVAQTTPGQNSSIITISGTNQVTDIGAGNDTIQFLGGTSRDTLVLHPNSVDQVSGFDPTTDVLDLRSLLNGTGFDLTGNVVALSHYLTVADQGADALLRFDPTGQGGGSTIAVLQGLASAVTGLDSLVAQGAIRTG